MSLRSLAIVSCVAATLATPFVDAHARVYEPAPEYTISDRNKNWSPQAFLEKQGFKTSNDFVGYLKQNGYETLRDFMDKPGVYKPEKGATFECGWSNPNATAKAIPNSKMRLSGYTHDGPCEVWLDDVRVLHGDQCNKEFTGQEMKIDYSSCKQKGCMMKWYWLGIRPFKPVSWQIYKECIPLKGTGEAASDNDSVPTTKPTTKAPVPTSQAPAPTTKAPAPTTKAPTPTTKSPTPTTNAPVPTTTDPDTTAAPDATKTPSCNRRRD
ncbi:hypothetical protein Poli38472_008771 [Pythium oligandrum]|uniref:Uncharacterized protein n=1 Tax=Pythium oligandrum TaxID=41045 RepID=A0A8K1C4D6_PYTOL|nr:hypothetical protein Poli38472_008771 [Pythium oligandrum]|eukprot:TMW56123.1 hypothetical protein Poli38472_008771 [Pythium oligandrum]